MKYYLLSNITRILLGKLRKYHKEDEQLLVFSKDFIGEEIFAFGKYEKTETRTIIDSLNFNCSNYNALDIGANIGNHSLIFSKYFKNVYCFEPNELVFQVLKINTRNKNNIHIHNMGLSDQDSKSYLSVPEGNIGGGKVTDNNNSVEISLKKFDDNYNMEYSFIKIDVEGHEISTFKGMKDSIKENKPIISFELLNSDEQSGDIILFLKDLGYENFYVPHEPKLLIFKNSNSFLANFLSGLFLRNKYQLKRITNFNKPFYNLVLCEHHNSIFKIKKENIRK